MSEDEIKAKQLRDAPGMMNASATGRYSYDALGNANALAGCAYTSQFGDLSRVGHHMPKQTRRQRFRLWVISVLQRMIYGK